MKFIQRNQSCFPNELYHFMCLNDWQLKEFKPLKSTFSKYFSFKLLFTGFHNCRVHNFKVYEDAA